MLSAGRAMNALKKKKKSEYNDIMYQVINE